MVRRNLRFGLRGGAYVFPGGSVDPLDGGTEAEALCVGRSDAEASAVLGRRLRRPGLLGRRRPRDLRGGGHLLLAAPRVVPTCWPATPARRQRFAAERRAVNAGTRRFLDLCRDERLQLVVGDVHYFAHWITPRGAPRRYDTRFFVAPAPPGQMPRTAAGETIAEVWISPHDALARHRSGEIEIIFPTIRNLQAIEPLRHQRELLAAAEQASSAGPDH